MFLSSQAINQKSAYQVLQKNSNTFLFITDNSVTLEVGFVEDYTLEIEGVYQFFILNDSSDISHTPKDPNIKQTIFAIFEEFFKQDSSTILYVCDISDGRQNVRDRLFRIWFEEYHDKYSYCLEHAQIAVEDTEYFISILSRADNPNWEKILISFRSMAEDLQMKLP